VARRIVRFVLLVVAVWVVVVVLAATLQRQLIYLPDRSRPSPPAGVEAVTLTTADGLELVAWFVPAVDPATAASTVLVAPGNAGNRALRLPLAVGLAERGHAVLLLEYRGYGGNPGRPSEDGLLDDARAARRHLDTRDDADPAPIVYLGESLGTGVVSSLAVEAPPAALVLRSPFPELADVGRSAYPFLPVRWLLRDRYPVSEHLTSYEGPVLVVAGGADTIVPTTLSRQVADRAGATWVELPGVDHNDRALLDGADYLDAVDTFVRRELSGR
jgi:uncharacterized protein